MVIFVTTYHMMSMEKKPTTYFWYQSSPCSCDHPFLWKQSETWRPLQPPPPLERPWSPPHPPRLCGNRLTGRSFSHSAQRRHETRSQDEALFQAKPSLWRCRPPADSPWHLFDVTREMGERRTTAMCSATLKRHKPLLSLSFSSFPPSCWAGPVLQRAGTSPPTWAFL